IVLVAPGTGFAPNKALVEAAYKKRVARPMRLYGGARRLKGRYLKGLAEDWVAEHPGSEHVPEVAHAAWADQCTVRAGFVQRAETSASRMMPVKALRKISTTAAGVPAGANKPNQLSPSNFVRPVSLTVGPSGRWPDRPAEDTASPFSLPDWTYCLDADMLSNI